LRSQRVETRRQLRNQLFVRSIGQRLRPFGSRGFARRRPPRSVTGDPAGGGGSLRRRRRLITGSTPRALTSQRSCSPS
jgi:hypothetical protein